MAYTPSSLTIDSWTVPISIVGTDTITTLDNTVNAIIDTDASSIKAHINTELAKIPTYLSTELTTMYNDLGVQINVISGLTATAAELNTLDGITSTTAELNKLDGYSGSVTELNYLKALYDTGVTNAEFDYLDGVTGNIQTQLDAKDVLSDTSPQLGGDLDFNGKTMNKSAVRQIADATPSTGTTHTFDYANGDMQQITCPASGTLTLAVSNFPSGDVAGFIADIVNGGNCTITHNPSWLFAGGVAPTYTTAGTDRVLFTSDKDGAITLTVIARNIGTV